MRNNPMKVFISNARKDQYIATRISKELKKNEFDVITDDIEFTSSNLSTSITEKLSESDIFLSIITDDSLKNHFVDMEITTAIGYRDARQKPFIFTYIIGNPDLIPDSLKHISSFIGSGDIQNDIKKIIMHLNSYRGAYLAKQQEDLENKEIIQNSLASYIDEVFAKLEKNERSNKALALFCYFCSAILLIFSIIFSIFETKIINLNGDIFQMIETLFSNTLSLAIIIALSRMTFILGKSFMVESIRNGDRIHAISFGKFFINAYGDKATREEIREVFGEWNIDKGSSFQTQDTKDFDPNVLGAFEIIKSAINKK